MSANQPLASGSGLSHGRTGEVCKFHVKMPAISDESKGKLSMGISGPSKVVLESQHTSDGFDVSYTPLEEGDYQLTVKCDGKHIPGSPFSIAVEKNPEFVPVSFPAKCKASGPGLRKGVALKPCYFSVDTTNAGMSVCVIEVLPQCRRQLVHVGSVVRDLADRPSCWVCCLCSFLFCCILLPSMVSCSPSEVFR